MANIIKSTENIPNADGSAGANDLVPDHLRESFTARLGKKNYGEHFLAVASGGGTASSKVQAFINRATSETQRLTRAILGGTNMTDEQAHAFANQVMLAGVQETIMTHGGLSQAATAADPQAGAGRAQSTPDAALTALFEHFHPSGQGQGHTRERAR